MLISLGDRIKHARNRAGLTQVELAKKLKIAYPTLNKYEREHRIPDASLLSRMAKILGCDPGWLLSGENTDPDTDNLSYVTQTPVLNKVTDNFPDQVSEETCEYISLPDIPRGSFSLIVKGENMSPAIRENDYVIFNPSANIENGDIIIVNNEWGESMLRRYCIKKSEVFLVSDNPEYQAVMFDDNYRIIGKVVAVWRKIKI